MTRARSNQRGFALLIVLWSLVLLSLILTQLLSAGRMETQLAANLRNSAVAEAVADGAVQEALFHIVARDGPSAWAPAGTHTIRIGRDAAAVAIQDLSGKVNPNIAGTPILSAMFLLCGASPAGAVNLAHAIAAWRGDAEGSGNELVAAYQSAGMGYLPPAAPMQTLAELALIVGMTQSIVDCVAPHMSLYQDAPAGLDSNDPFVARAARLAEQQGDPVPETQAAVGSPAVQITATATVTGARFVRRVTARLTPSADGRPFRILQWDTGDD